MSPAPHALTFDPGMLSLRESRIWFLARKERRLARRRARVPVLTLPRVPSLAASYNSDGSAIESIDTRCGGGGEGGGLLSCRGTTVRFDL